MYTQIFGLQSLMKFIQHSRNMATLKIGMITVKKHRAMHIKYGVLCLSHLEHLIWREVTPKFWCVFYAKLGVLSHQLSVLSH